MKPRGGKKKKRSKIVHWFCAAVCRMEKHSGRSGLQGHDDCEGRLSVSHRLSLDTNLFDVITSLGTGLYVHHIELTSFPLCRLNRNLPVTVPGRDGEREGGREEGKGGEMREVVLRGRHKQQMEKKQ